MHDGRMAKTVLGGNGQVNGLIGIGYRHHYRILLLGAIYRGGQVGSQPGYSRTGSMIGLVKGGEIIPLEQLLQQVLGKEPGKLRLLEAELERKRGRLVYELELVDERGMVRKLLLDAKSGDPLN